MILVVAAAGPAPPVSPAPCHRSHGRHRLPLRPEPLVVDASVAAEHDLGLDTASILGVPQYNIDIDIVMNIQYLEN